jgi:hypothetical protein
LCRIRAKLKVSAADKTCLTKLAELAASRQTFQVGSHPEETQEERDDQRSGSGVMDGQDWH